MKTVVVESVLCNLCRGDCVVGSFVVESCVVKSFVMEYVVVGSL